MSSTNPFAEDAADARHGDNAHSTTNRAARLAQGAMDRHAEVVGGQPIRVDREQLRRSVAAGPKSLTEWAERAMSAPESTTAPSPLLSPIPADVMRAAIKTALNDLLHIDLVNDETDDVAAKLRGIAAGLIEAL